MTAFSVALEAELQKRVATIFGAITIELPSHAAKVLDGAGRIETLGQTYRGRDSVLGVLDSIEQFQDGVGDQAPGLSMTFLPPSEVAPDALATAEFQGSPVRMHLGAIDTATGLVIGDPLLLFSGELDVATLEIGEETRSVTYDCVSTFERLFENDEGARLNPSFHEEVWPGELGLSHVTGVENTRYWGQTTPNPGVTPS